MGPRGLQAASYRVNWEELGRTGSWSRCKGQIRCILLSRHPCPKPGCGKDETMGCFPKKEQYFKEGDSEVRVFAADHTEGSFQRWRCN